MPHRKMIRERARREAKAAMLDAANANRTITYGELAEKITAMTLPPNSPALEDILTQISRQEDAQGRGLLSVVVINQETEIPGDGFFRLAAERGYDVGDSHKEFFVQHIEEVYAHHRGP